MCWVLSYFILKSEKEKTQAVMFGEDSQFSGHLQAVNGKGL